MLKALEDVLQAEIAAINSYFIHAKLLANWGYTKLSTKAYEESMDEMRHTEQLVDRIVYFDAIPNLNKIGRVKVGKTVREQFELALDLETGQVGRINARDRDLQRRQRRRHPPRARADGHRRRGVDRLARDPARGARGARRQRLPRPAARLTAGSQHPRSPESGAERVTSSHSPGVEPHDD